LQAKAAAGESFATKALETIPTRQTRHAAHALQTEVFAIVADHTGAPRALVDENKDAVWRAEVVGYGEAIPDAGNLVTLNLRGSNQYFDAETGLHYNTRRYLDPASGRYLSADPLGLAGGSNPYVFGDNNPLDRIDPMGLQSKPTGPVSTWAFDEKLKYVFEHVAQKTPGELGDALKELVSPSSLATTAAIFGIWTGAQFTPYGWAADVALAGIGAAFLGAEVWDVITGLYKTATLISGAKCEADLQEAGGILAKGLGIGTVEVAIGGASGKKIAGLLKRIFKHLDETPRAATVAKISQSWFGTFVPGRIRSGNIANKEHVARRGPTTYPPWDKGSVTDKWLDPGTKIYMVNEVGAVPGGWATPQTFTNLKDARDALSLLYGFKQPGPNCCTLQEYTVKSPIPVREGIAGPLTSRDPPFDSYPGGAMQWELLLDRSLTKGEGWRKFLVPTGEVRL
jgi:RHS repeat-associated protein